MAARRPALSAFCRCGNMSDRHGACKNCGLPVDQNSQYVSTLAQKVRVSDLLVDPSPQDMKKWYEVEEGKFPHKRVSECDGCGRAVHSGQVVYIDRKKRVDLHEPYFVMHKECMQDLLNAAPDTQYDLIRERLKSGGPLF